MSLKKTTLFLSIASMLSLISCGNNDEDIVNGIDISQKNYSDYQEFHLDKLEDFYGLEGTYSVQLYYESCPSCKNVRPYLFRHLENLKAGTKKYKTYIFDMKRKKGETLEEATINRNKFKSPLPSQTREECVNEMLKKEVSTLSETYYFGVPALYVVENHKLKEFHYDANNVSDFYRYLD